MGWKGIRVKAQSNPIRLTKQHLRPFQGKLWTTAGHRSIPQKRQFEISELAQLLHGIDPERLLLRRLRKLGCSARVVRVTCGQGGVASLSGGCYEHQGKDHHHKGVFMRIRRSMIPGMRIRSINTLKRGDHGIAVYSSSLTTYAKKIDLQVGPNNISQGYKWVDKLLEIMKFWNLWTKPSLESRYNRMKALEWIATSVFQW